MSADDQKGGARKPWGGRFRADTDPAVEAFTASIDFDRALARYDLRLSRAHAEMLRTAGLLSAEDLEALQRGLARVGEEIESGSFPFDARLEDIHMNVEARLRELVGEAAGRLHTGRSRNDQVATDLLLYLRDASLAARRGILSLQGVLVERAREHLDTVLPGYTHLQRAQPVRLAHHWLAFVEMFGRDGARFRDLGGRLQHSPLGSGALAGSTLPLDRAATAAALGFRAPTRNSLDAVASRDVAAEFLAAVAIAQVQLSRLAEELVLWSSAEFGFVELADAYSTGSSLMPQKKNPDVPELVRGKSGRTTGNLVALLTVLKGLPLTYNRDLQEDKEPIFDSARTLRDSLEVMAGAVATLRVDESRMREGRGRPDAPGHGPGGGPGARGRALPRSPRGRRPGGGPLPGKAPGPALPLPGRPAGLPRRLPRRGRRPHLPGAGAGGAGAARRHRARPGGGGPRLRRGRAGRDTPGLGGCAVNVRAWGAALLLCAMAQAGCGAYAPARWPEPDSESATEAEPAAERSDPR